MADDILDRAGDWTLAVRDGELEARRPIPYDGALYYSTKDRSNSPRKNSQFGLSVKTVVARYVQKSPTERSQADLLRTARLALTGVLS